MQVREYRVGLLKGMVQMVMRMCTRRPSEKVRKRQAMDKSMSLDVDEYQRQQVVKTKSCGLP